MVAFCSNLPKLEVAAVQGIRPFGTGCSQRHAVKFTQFECRFMDLAKTMLEVSGIDNL